jgi:hypothetical protein
MRVKSASNEQAEKILNKEVNDQQIPDQNSSVQAAS